MNEVKSFSFYRSYYEALNKKGVSEEDKKELIYAMINYAFEDAEPNFEGIREIMWTLMKPNLKTSKNRSNINSGAPIGNENAKKNNEKKENNQKTIKKQSITLDISIPFYSNLFLSNSYSNNIIILIKEYLELRIEEKYNMSETIIKRLIKKLNEYGKTDEEKEELLLKAINGKWKDFYPLNEKENKKGGVIYERV